MAPFVLLPRTARTCLIPSYLRHCLACRRSKLDVCEHGADQFGLGESVDVLGFPLV